MYTYTYITEGVEKFCVLEFHNETLSIFIICRHKICRLKSLVEMFWYTPVMWNMAGASSFDGSF